MQTLPTLGFAKLSCNAYGDWLESWTQTFFVHAVLLTLPRKLVTKTKGLISLCLRVWEGFFWFQEKSGERLKTNPFTLNSKMIPHKNWHSPEKTMTLGTWFISFWNGPLFRNIPQFSEQVCSKDMDKSPRTQMTDILGGSTHKAQGQPPQKKEVTWVLGRSYTLPFQLT